MTMNKKYLDTLKEIGGWATVSEWAVKFCQTYPDLLEKANREAAKQKNPTTGLREIAARMSSQISRGAFTGTVEVDESERPRRVRYVTSEQIKEYERKEIEEDIEPLTRSQKMSNDYDGLSTREKYRLDEMENIAQSLNNFFRLDFEVDHAQTVLNHKNPGKHHLRRSLLSRCQALGDLNFRTYGALSEMKAILVQ